MKLCKKCFGCFENNSTEFYETSGGGLYNVCKTCCNIRDKKYHVDHRDERSEYNKQYNKKKKKELSKYHQAYRDTHRATLAALRALRAAGKRTEQVKLGLTRYKKPVASDAKKFLVKIWLLSHPDTTIKECSIGTKVTWRTARKYMIEIKKENQNV